MGHVRHQLILGIRERDCPLTRDRDQDIRFEKKSRKCICLKWVDISLKINRTKRMVQTKNFMNLFIYYILYTAVNVQIVCHRHRYRHDIVLERS